MRIPGIWQNGRQSHTDDSVTLVGVGTGGQESTQDVGEAIVILLNVLDHFSARSLLAKLGRGGDCVGAVGSAAPWFLMGWADGVEVELMIDTGYQVTILATSVFERMCLCGRRLVLADSSPLIVRGELEMTVVFPGLSCERVVVVASIASDGLMPCSRVCHISWIYGQDNCGRRVD